jgi:hypothetical protein
MPGKLPTLSPAASRQIEGRVDELFDRLMTRLLGHGFTGRRLFIGFNEDLSLPGIFAAATTGEGGRVDTAILSGIADIAKDYLDKHRAEAKARTKQHIQALLRDLNEGRIDAAEFQNYVESDLHQLWDSVRSAVERVVETENEHAESLGIKDGIDQINASLGVDDPVVCFIPVKDDRLCDECRRLHLLPDGVTPRVWYSSEVEANYHKKGVDRPSWQKLHPHCRCSPATVLPGFGFDENGRVTFISRDHDELAYQRSYKRPPRGEGPRLKKLGKSESPAPARPRSFDTVYHVGDLDKPRVTNMDSSLEGGELSVSHHPEDWKRIARIGGKTYTLRKPGAKFLEVGPTIVGRPDRRKEWNDWGVKNGYLQQGTWHRVSWKDEDDGDERFSDYDDPKQAQADVNDAKAYGNSPRTVKAVSGYRFGPKGQEYWKRSALGDIRHEMAEDYAPIFFARHHGYDGVWWHERYDPDNLSAPRGLIFQESLPSWKRVAVKPDSGLRRSEPPALAPLLKFDVKYADLARAFKEHGWEEARTTGHVIWKHTSIPGRPVPVKQDHASGAKPIDDQMLRDHYLRQAGLTIDRGGGIVPSAKHPYAEHYARLGFQVPGYRGPAEQKTWTPQRAPEGLRQVPIEHLDPGPFEEWQAGMHAKNFHTGKAHLVPHVTAMDLGDGRLTVDHGSEVVEAARRAGMTHVPVLQS